MTPHFSICIQILIEKLSLRKNLIKPDFSYRLLNIIGPIWSLMAPNINVELSEFQKNHTPNAAYITGYRKNNDKQYRNHISIYTDCSRGDAGVGAAAVCGTVVNAVFCLLRHPYSLRRCMQLT